MFAGGRGYFPEGHEDAVRRVWPESMIWSLNVRRFGLDWWAPYVPEDIGQIPRCRDGFKFATDQTCNAALAPMKMILLALAPLRYVARAFGVPVVAAGWSNGAIIAGELAVRGELHGLYIGSGCLAAKQQQQLEHLPGCCGAVCVLTLARRETYWGGPCGVRRAATLLWPKIFDFEGWHAQDPWHIQMKAWKHVRYWVDWVDS